MRHALVLLLITACLTLHLSCTKSEPKTTEPSPAAVSVKSPKAVEGMTLVKNVLSREVTASGTAAGIHESHVVSETQGKILKVNFALGQKVTRGDVLVQVNETVQLAAHEQAKRALAAADLAMKVTQKLFNEGNASDAELGISKSQMTGAQTQLESTRKALNDCRIIAPINGFIAQKGAMVEPGNVLAGGTMVARIVDISSLKTTVAIGEMELGMLHKGMPVSIRCPAVGSTVFNGTITAIAAGSDPATGSYPVEISWPNTRDRAIKAGMSVSVTCNSVVTDSALIVPLQYIVTKENRKAVFITSEDKAILRFITTGRIAGNSAEILSGLEPGQILVTTGITTLTSGDPVVVTLKSNTGGVE